MQAVDKSDKIIVVLGPTAAGKTKIAVRLAADFDGEIISADSRQVYRGMDVGTGKDLQEYRVEKVQSSKFKVQNKLNPPAGEQNSKFVVIPHRLIDVADPKTNFNVAKYQKLAYRAIADILGRGRVPIICGGTGLYIDAVLKGYLINYELRITNHEFKKIRKKLEKQSLEELLEELKKIDLATWKVIDKKNRRRVQRAVEIFYETGRPKSEIMTMKRPPYQFLEIGINYPREILNERIEKRLKERLAKEDMIGEVRKLHRQGVSWRRLDDFGLEYRWISRYLRGQISYNEMADSLARDIKAFAKRQMTWFKRDKEIVWENDYKRIKKVARDFLE